MDEQIVIAIRNTESAKIERVDAGRDIRYRHQILAIGADIHRVMVDRVLAAADIPLQRIRGDGGRYTQTVINARFYLGSLLIIVPRHQLQIRQLIRRVVHAVDLGKGLQPGLSALLPYDAVQAPGCQRVVESLIARSNRLLVWVRQSGLIETGQVPEPIVAAGRDHPRIPSIGKIMAEAAVVLKDKSRLCIHAGSGGIPINRVRIIDREIRDHRLPAYLHVSRGREVSVLDILQVAFQRMLRRTTRAGIPLDRSLIDHDRKSKARMGLRLCHHQLRRLVH